MRLDSAGGKEAGMPDKTRWEAFFDAHAPVYDENTFTKNTLREVDFLLAELRLAPGSAILDVGCGTGRHAVELAKRGQLSEELSRFCLALTVLGG
jgi:cyclopropane fatty-acyl-phospholipid synthase-like methyltransferase